MKKPSKALVNKLQEFSFNQKSIDELNLFENGRNNFHLIHENNSHQATLIASNYLNRTYSIKVNSNIYDVEIQRPVDDIVNKMGYAVRSTKTVDSIKAPMPYVSLVPTGGVSVENMHEWFDNGASALGIGSAILKGFNPKEKNYNQVTKNSLEFYSKCQLLIK